MKKIVVICGPSGVGKTTLLNYILKKYKASKIITHTTRPKRTNEIDGIDYYFETDASFDKHNYLEEVSYANYRYGSSVEGIKKAHEKADLAVIILDTVGAIKYQQYFDKDQIDIFFITISNKDDLLSRLVSRGDDESLVKERINAKEFYRDMEVPKALANTAKVIVNDDLESAKKQIDNIITKI